MSLEVHEDWIYRYSLRCDILSEKLESTKVNTNSFHATHDRQYLVLKLLSFFYEYMCCVLKHPWYLFLNLAEISGFTLSPPPKKGNVFGLCTSVYIFMGCRKKKTL
jgi:hypothetical protein